MAERSVNVAAAREEKWRKRGRPPGQTGPYAKPRRHRLHLYCCVELSKAIGFAEMAANRTPPRFWFQFARLYNRLPPPSGRLHTAAALKATYFRARSEFKRHEAVLRILAGADTTKPQCIERLYLSRLRQLSRQIEQAVENGDF